MWPELISGHFSLCEMVAAVDAGDGPQNLPLRERLRGIGKKNFSGAACLRAIEPATEEAEMIGNRLAGRLRFGRR